MYTIYIPDWTPTPLNKLLKVHWSNSRKMKKTDAEIISAYSRSCVPATIQKRSVSLIIILPKGQRACDPDAYWKSLLDGLVKCGLLVNDSARWCQNGFVEFARGERLASFIILEDL